MIVDAIVLTGGRSSRLGSTPKSELRYGGRTLLRRTLSTLKISRRIVVVGSEPAEPLPGGVLRTREVPPFGGPAAAIAAGIASLAGASAQPSDIVLVIACDMPHVDRAIPLVLQALVKHPDADGVVPIDSAGHRQPLAAAYRASRLAAVISVHERDGSLHGLPVSQLIRGLVLLPIDVPNEATADVDTWDDALRLGVTMGRTVFEPTKESHE